MNTKRLSSTAAYSSALRHVERFDPRLIPGLVFWMDAGYGVHRCDYFAPVTLNSQVTAGTPGYAGVEYEGYHRILVYPYRSVNGRRYYSVSCIYGETTGPVNTDHYIDWSWSAVPGVDGYRVLSTDDWVPDVDSYSRFVDVTTPSLHDTGPDTFATVNDTMDYWSLPSNEGNPAFYCEDRSGLGHHCKGFLEFESDAYVPTWQPYAANGRPALRFNDQWEGLVSTASLSDPKSLSVFTVYSATSATVSTPRRVVQGDGVNWLIGPYCARYQVFNGGYHQGPPVELGRLVIHSVIQAPPSSEKAGSRATRQYLNRALVSQCDAVASAPMQLAIGAGGMFPEPAFCDLAEVLAYNQPLEDPDRLMVENYLARKYGIG